MFDRPQTETEMASQDYLLTPKTALKVLLFMLYSITETMPVSYSNFNESDPYQNGKCVALMDTDLCKQADMRLEVSAYPTCGDALDEAVSIDQNPSVRYKFTATASATYMLVKTQYVHKS